MEFDPVYTLKRPYRAPFGAPGLGSSGINKAGVNIARTESPYFAGNLGSSSSAYKRQKLASGVYRDEETTGYEDDGSEASWAESGFGRSVMGCHGGEAGNTAAPTSAGLTPLGLKVKTNVIAVPEESNRAEGSKDCYYAVSSFPRPPSVCTEFIYHSLVLMVRSVARKSGVVPLISSTM